MVSENPLLSTESTLLATSSDSVANLKFKCTKPHCWYSVVSAPWDSIESLSRHKCPYGSSTTIGWSVQMSLVNKMWQLLDADIAKIQSGLLSPEELVHAKYHAKGIAECLVLFMTPFYTTIQDISRESLQRWKAKEEGDTSYETRGLGSLAFQSPPPAPSSSMSPSSTKVTSPPPAKVTPTVENIKKAEMILAAVKSGIMSPEEIAKVLKVDLWLVQRMARHQER